MFHMEDNINLINKKDLIVDLIKQRSDTLEQPIIAKHQADFNGIRLHMPFSSQPEGTIVNIIEIWHPLSKLGISDEIIIKGMETYLSRFISGEKLFPVP